ncbi:histidine phosphatase family protein [Amycolatopsis suaedae]|uniref:Histidine phosphatase family protein n=1 Tax=Amycolatopsis suaedae TaxID=2510978 RepID=A0A4V2ELZ2_9PSEU|nr:histidine phosphatase family protein [Amycolatopsis suaedae]RZQ63255.1 histidine phosphatase family protein [Amycolatopsis suaedae]
MPEGATELVLIRHGESRAAREDSPFPLVDGHADPELAEEGQLQAKRIADRFGGQHFDALYVTPLRRTAETAAPLAQRLGLTPRLRPELREIHLGDWEGGLFRIRTAQGHPLAVRCRAEQRWEVIPGAESNDAFAARVRAGVERLAADHPGERVAVVTHAGVIAQVFALASGSTPFAFLGADNGSVSQVVVHGPQWTPRRFNDVAHLED